MKILILEKKEFGRWEKFIAGNNLASVFQTVEWAEFQVQVDGIDKFWIVVIEDKDGKILGGSMIIKRHLFKKYSWLYASRGPIFDFSDKVVFDNFLKKVGEIAEKEDAVFVRFDPLIKEKPPVFQKLYEVKYGFQPQTTLMLDIDSSEEDILSQMKPKGRYNIKLAEKKGVRVRAVEIEKIGLSGQNGEKYPEDLKNFYKILQETTKRDGFYCNKLEFYEKMIRILGEKNMCKLYVAEFEGKIIAGIIATFFGDTAIYYYGASGNEYRNLMAPYLLQWTVICEARSRGMKYYDFLGIAPEGSKNHPWAGVTEFKKKFGGREVSYIAAHEKVYKLFLYILYRIYKVWKK